MKLDIIFHYEVDETTGNITYIGKDEITVDTTVTKKTNSNKKVDNNPDPIVTLESNKLVFTQGAVELLNVSKDNKIDIKYKKKDKQSIPVIGTDESFGTKGGNVLTASNTVSFRGTKNDKLSEFGNIFTLEPTEESGIYYLIGNKEQEEQTIPEEILDIESELDVTFLDDINEEDESNFGNFKFEL